MRIAAFALLLTACVPSQHDEAHYGRVTIAFGAPLDSSGPWRGDQIAELRAELSALDALGPTFIEASEGSAQIVVRPFDSGPSCALGAGRWLPGTSFIEIDPACAHGYAELRTAMGHEVGHALGLAHVCTRPGETADCSVVGFGFAMMNPSLSYGDVFSDMGPNDIVSDAPTDLDLAEFRRTHR